MARTAARSARPTGASNSLAASIMRTPPRKGQSLAPARSQADAARRSAREFDGGK